MIGGGGHPRRGLPAPTGYTRQQTINCDYIVVAQNAQVHTVNAEELYVNQLVAPVITQLLSRVETLEKEVRELTNRLAAAYETGETVQFSVHLADVDLENMSENEIESLELNYRTAIASEAGVDVAQVAIIGMVPTGSADITTEIKYKKTNDEGANDQITENKKRMIDKLNNNEILTQLSGVGEVDVSTESIQEDPIKSIAARVVGLENFLHRDSIDFSRSTSITINRYKLETSTDNLKITRFDDANNTYVAGNLSLEVT